LDGQRGQRGPRCELWKHGGKTVEANTVADLSPGGLLAALPADGLLAPGAHSLEIVLTGECLMGLLQRLAGCGKEPA